MTQVALIQTAEMPRRRAMVAHERSEGQEQWLTDPRIIQACGQFDLDPAAPVSRPWPMAAHHFTIHDNGLVREWFGRVWLNPPYGNQAIRWMRRMVAHGNGVALLFARTETQMFFDCVWDAADAVLFLRKRVTFYTVDGKPGKWTSGGPVCLIAYGAQNVDALAQSGIDGKLIRLK